MPTIYNYSLYHVNLNPKTQSLAQSYSWKFLIFFKKIEKKVKKLEFFFPIISWIFFDWFFLSWGGCERTKTDGFFKNFKELPNTGLSLMVVS